MNKLYQFLSKQQEKAIESWSLADEDNEIYVPVIHRDGGQAVFIEVNTLSETKKIKVFMKESDASKYKLTKEKHKVLLAKTKIKTLTAQMSKYVSPNTLKMDCIICTYDVDDKLYELYLLWTNFNN